MDFHAEQLITKKKTSKDILLTALIIIGVIVLWAILFLLLSPIGFSTVAVLLIFFSGWGALKLIQMLSIEYEYELINHYLDIDKIMGQSRRKRVVSIDFKNIEICTYISAPEFNNTFGIDKTIDVSGRNGEKEELMFVDFIPEGGKKTRVIFRPCEKIRDCLKKAAPKTVKL